ncbi:hypothetical protein AAG570_003992 [Ranatra chinensis]|uniref:Uncharacterized protein n=1 Tax=Ranatra chinensis TaxID=642074 RepID=A0ABD0Y2H4_9HEMI
MRVHQSQMEEVDPYSVPPPLGATLTPLVKRLWEPRQYTVHEGVERIKDQLGGMDRESNWTDLKTMGELTPLGNSDHSIGNRIDNLLNEPNCRFKYHSSEAEDLGTLYRPRVPLAYLFAIDEIIRKLLENPRILSRMACWKGERCWRGWKQNSCVHYVFPKCYLNEEQSPVVPPTCRSRAMVTLDGRIARPQPSKTKLEKEHPVPPTPLTEAESVPASVYLGACDFKKRPSVFNCMVLHDMITRTGSV